MLSIYFLQAGFNIWTWLCEGSSTKVNFPEGKIFDTMVVYFDMLSAFFARSGPFFEPGLALSFYSGLNRQKKFDANWLLIFDMLSTFFARSGSFFEPDPALSFLFRIE
jgi:hypothetical protein